LTAYLKLLQNNSVRVFKDININVIDVEIPPEYRAYIDNYGYPEGSVFDPDKLAGFVKN
jgi:hypothetical protein